jgi:IstB-like ATP binding protein
MKARRVDDAETIHWTCPIDKSTMFTTQLPIDHWSEVIADSVIADAIRDRLEHSALTIHITGESYRGVKAKTSGGVGIGREIVPQGVIIARDFAQSLAAELRSGQGSTQIHKHSTSALPTYYSR